MHCELASPGGDVLDLPHFVNPPEFPLSIESYISSIRPLLTDNWSIQTARRLSRFYLNVRDAIEKKATLEVTPEQASRTMRAVTLAHESSHEHRRVEKGRNGGVSRRVAGEILQQLTVWLCGSWRVPHIRCDPRH